MADAGAALDGLAQLDERLGRAREALGRLDRPPPDKEKHTLSRALDVAHAAVASLGAFAGGLERSYSAGAIGVRRDGRRVTVVVAGEPARAEVEAFVEELRGVDARLLEAAELLGLLVGLSARWVAAGFAPVAVLSSLRESAPRILELGEGLLERRAEHAEDGGGARRRPEPRRPGGGG